jgi:hypothetical protein
MMIETEETGAFEIEEAETRVISGFEPIEIGEEKSGMRKFGAKAHVDVFDDAVYKGDEYLPFIVYAKSKDDVAEQVTNYLRERNEELEREGKSLEVEVRNVTVWKCESDCPR